MLPEVTRDTAAKLPTFTHPSYQPPTVLGALVSSYTVRVTDELPADLAGNLPTSEQFDRVLHAPAPDGENAP